MPRVLPRYLYSQHCKLLMYYLIGGCGIYLLIDVFDRLDNFLRKDAPLGIILEYFLFKIPLIVSQILPMVYLLSLLTLFAIMKRKNELMALECGGVKFLTMMFLFLIYSFLWSGLEFAFSQAFGVVSKKRCDYIWENMGKKVQEEKVKDLWFRNKNTIIHIGNLYEASKIGKDVVVVFVKKDFKGLKSIIEAKRISFQGNRWVLKKVRVFDCTVFSIKTINRLVLDNMPLVKKIVFVKKEEKVEELTPWQLKKVISSLKKSGTSVENFLFVWHQKMAYSLSIVVLTLLAFCLIRTFNSLFLKLTVALGIVFILYALFNFSEHLFVKGSLPFWLGAWLANIVGVFIGGIWFTWRTRKI